jgi:Tfp pilus assembly protein PilV
MILLIAILLAVLAAINMPAKNVRQTESSRWIDTFTYEPPEKE